MEDKKVLTTLEEVKAISDPYRYRILSTLIDMNEPATVKQIADKLSEVPAKVHYHIKKLEKAEIIKLVYTKEINGIIAKYYEPVATDFEIKCSKEIEEPTKKMMLAESQRMLSELYNDSKEIFLNSVGRSMEESKDKEGKGAIITNNLYLTEEEANEIMVLMESFFKKHKVEDTKKIKYHSFFTIIKNRE